MMEISKILQIIRVIMNSPNMLYIYSTIRGKDIGGVSEYASI